MFLIYFISYGCNGGALVFLGGAEASASPSFALPMFITIKKIIILHLFLGATPWHTCGYAPDANVIMGIFWENGILRVMLTYYIKLYKFSASISSILWSF